MPGMAALRRLCARASYLSQEDTRATCLPLRRNMVKLLRTGAIGGRALLMSQRLHIGRPRTWYVETRALLCE